MTDPYQSLKDPTEMAARLRYMANLIPLTINDNPSTYVVVDSRDLLDAAATLDAALERAERAEAELAKSCLYADVIRPDQQTRCALKATEDSPPPMAVQVKALINEKQAAEARLTRVVEAATAAEWKVRSWSRSKSEIPDGAVREVLASIADNLAAAIQGAATEAPE